MKIKQNIILLSLLLLSFSACQFASFTERPGVIVKSYPEPMYGTYQHIEKSNGVSDTHTLVVSSAGASINDGAISRIVNLSDSNNTLSHLGDFYYMNVKETDSTGRYTYFVYPFEYDAKHIYIYKILLSKKSIKHMQKAGLHISTRQTGEYVMDNMAFKKYVEKHMKRKDAIKFNKINK